MYKYMSIVKSGMARVLIIGGCCTLLMTGSAFAETSAAIDQRIAVSQESEINGVVEVGITPYSDANADYLYEIFGMDMVKIVEGQQAVTLGTGQEAAQ